jgi:hypothetical protein
MTLMEVLLAMAIFLIGSVSLVGLFVTASALHADAMNRRRASFIADELLAEVRSLRFREVFAKTRIAVGGDAGARITVDAVYPDVLNQGADFATYPVHYLFNAATSAGTRTSGPILLEGQGGATPVPREWAWYDGWNIASRYFDPVTRGLWGTAATTHADTSRILQPRSWRYVLGPPGPGAGTINATVGTIPVWGDPTSAPAAPVSGYIVIDEEWMPYASRDANGFTVALDNNGVPYRGWGGTKAAAHSFGTPVTVAREHPFYPGFYYTVQFYPTDATGSSAQVIITVGYGNPNFFHVHTFHTIYTPTSY